MSYCTACGAPLDGTEKFCRSCGTKVSVAASPAKSEAIPVSTQTSAAGTSAYTKQPPVSAASSGRRRTLGPIVIFAGLIAVAAVVAYVALGPFGNTPFNQFTATRDNGSIAAADTGAPKPLFGMEFTELIQQQPSVQPVRQQTPAQPVQRQPVRQQQPLPTGAAARAYVERTSKAYADAGISAIAAHHLTIPGCASCAPFLAYCTKPIGAKSDLAGRKVRAGGEAAITMVRSAGGQAVLLPFSEVAPAMRAGIIECSVSGGAALQ